MANPNPSESRLNWAAYFCKGDVTRDDLQRRLPLASIFELAPKLCSTKSNKNCKANRPRARVTRHGQLSTRRCCAENRRCKLSQGDLALLQHGTLRHDQPYSSQLSILFRNAFPITQILRLITFLEEGTHCKMFFHSVLYSTWPD